MVPKVIETCATAVEHVRGTRGVERSMEPGTEQRRKPTKRTISWPCATSRTASPAGDLVDTFCTPGERTLVTAIRLLFNGHYSVAAAVQCFASLSIKKTDRRVTSRTIWLWRVRAGPHRRLKLLASQDAIRSRCTLVRDVASAKRDPAPGRRQHIGIAFRTRRVIAGHDAFFACGYDREAIISQRVRGRYDTARMARRDQEQLVPGLRRP